MVKPVSTYLALAQVGSVVLYQPNLPQRQNLPFPLVKVSFDGGEESRYEPPRGEGDLCYDSEGLPTNTPKRGVFLDVYF
jgi:hypothetical protein